MSRVAALVAQAPYPIHTIMVALARGRRVALHACAAEVVDIDALATAALAHLDDPISLKGAPESACRFRPFAAVAAPKHEQPVEHVSVRFETKVSRECQWSRVFVDPALLKLLRQKAGGGGRCSKRRLRRMSVSMGLCARVGSTSTDSR